MSRGLADREALLRQWEAVRVHATSWAEAAGALGVSRDALRMAVAREIRDLTVLGVDTSGLRPPWVDVEAAVAERQRRRGVWLRVRASGGGWAEAARRLGLPYDRFESWIRREATRCRKAGQDVSWCYRIGSGVGVMTQRDEPDRQVAQDAVDRINRERGTDYELTEDETDDGENE